jgi:hypothetical protein
MNEIERFFERAASWQADRRALSWTEKVRRVERLLPELRAWREARRQPAGRAAAESSGQRLEPADTECKG